MTEATLTPDTAAAIVRRLSVGQISTIMGMSAQPCMLGCAEACAKRLMRPSETRPGLVDRVWNERVALYALNADGMAVRAVLEGAA